MLPFLSNIYSFKAAATRLKNYLDSLKPFPQALSKNTLAQLILGDPTSYPSDIEGLFRIADRLHARLKTLEKPASHAQLQQHLSQAAKGITYEKLKTEIPPDTGSFRSYWDIPEDLLISMMGMGIDFGVVTHDYPKEFESMTELDPWKKLWLIDCQSSLKHPFMVPVPPKQIFGENIEYKNYTTLQKNKEFSGSEYFIIIALNADGREVGYIKWYFWGELNEIKGTGFHFRYLQEDSTIGYVSFDLRPCNSELGAFRCVPQEASSPSEFKQCIDMELEYFLSRK